MWPPGPAARTRSRATLLAAARLWAEENAAAPSCSAPRAPPATAGSGSLILGAEISWPATRCRCSAAILPPTSSRDRGGSRPSICFATPNATKRRPTPPAVGALTHRGWTRWRSSPSAACSPPLSAEQSSQTPGPGMRALSRLGLARLRDDPSVYRWFALGITTFTQAAASAVTSALGPIAPLLMAEFAISRAQVGLVQTSIYLSGTWSAMVGGRIADRAGERSALIVSGVITGAAALASGLVGPFWAFLSVAFIMGLGTGVQNPAGSAAVMRWFPPRRRAFAMGIRQTGVPVGGVLAATAWPWVATTWGWRTAYILAGVMALAGTALIALSYWDPEREGGAGSATRSMRALMADRQLWLLALTYNGQITAQYSVSVYFVLFLHEALDLPLIAA